MLSSIEQFGRISRRGFVIVVLGIIAASAAEPGNGRIAVKSSNLASVGYNQRTRVLEVEFRHGGLYRYFDVPKATYAALLAAESKGQYFSANVRMRFRFEKVKAAGTAKRK